MSKFILLPGLGISPMSMVSQAIQQTISASPLGHSSEGSWVNLVSDVLLWVIGEYSHPIFGIYSGECSISFLSVIPDTANNDILMVNLWSSLLIYHAFPRRGEEQRSSSTPRALWSAANGYACHQMLGFNSSYFGTDFC